MISADTFILLKYHCCAYDVLVVALKQVLVQLQHRLRGVHALGGNRRLAIHINTFTVLW